MSILINWIISALVIFSAAYILPGAGVADFQTAFVAALVLGIINAVIKPILLFLTLPINLLTLGLFTLVINAALILLTTMIVPGFHVDGFWSAFLFSLVLTVVNAVLHQLSSK